MYSHEIFDVSDGKHVMLVCENDSQQLEAAAHFINEGIRSDQLCIYASVHAFDSRSKLSSSNLSTRITDYQLNVRNGNLEFIDFRPFYESAAASNLSPFILLKKELEAKLSNRRANGKGDKVMVYADAACSLIENKEFDESGQLETWWQHVHEEWTNNGDKITVICPHPAHILKEEIQLKWRIADLHDMLIFSKSHMVGSSRSPLIKNDLRILIAESEADILTLLSDYLSGLGHKVSVVTDGNKCLSLFRKRDFDLIILDTHLTGYLTTKDLAKEIMRIEPHQRILVTSTHPRDNVFEFLGNSKSQTHQILQKPFHLSELAAVIMQIAKSH